MDEYEKKSANEHLGKGLQGLADHLTELEGSARKLQNQNFADIVVHARSRICQLIEHADRGLVAEQIESDHKGPAAEDLFGKAGEQKAAE